MESKIAGYKLVPEINLCEGCAYENNVNCPLYKDSNLDCVADGILGFIYVPIDTSIEVPKVNHHDRQRKD